VTPSPLSVLVTGGGSGIGRGVALGLARRGAALALCGRRPERLEAVCAEAREQGALRAVPLPADLAEDDGRACLLARATDALGGPPTVLIHNAALLTGGPLASRDERALEEAVCANLLAPLEITRRWLPAAPRGGTLVLVASMTALAPLPGASVYSATKAALRAFGMALAYEVAPRGVHVLTVFPPATATEMTRGMARSAAGRRYPMADAERVGERMAAAIAAGRTGDLNLMSGGERILAGLHRLFPAAARALLHARRGDFLDAVTPAGEEPRP